MKTTIIYMLLVAALSLFTASCEKTSIEDYQKNLGIENPGNPNSGHRPTKDGEIIETGLVDLGLSVKWSACNLDKNTTNHFTSMCSETGSDFNWSYESISYPPENISGTEYDNTTALLGGQWRTPTKEEMEEVYKRCRIRESNYRGVSGYTITGPSGKAIFLPRSSNTYYLTGTYNLISGKGYVWSLEDNTYSFASQTAYFVNFNNSKYNYIRPVYGPLK